MSVKDQIVIIDFETTGLSPESSRTIEVGALFIEDNKIVDSFEQLMNPGEKIHPFITYYTGITDEMVANAPSPEEVMPKLKEFIGERTIMGHNASFDKKFLCSEMERVNIAVTNPALCTLKLSRRLIAGSYSYNLGVLAEYLNLDTDDITRMHRALDDVKVTFRLWKYIQEEVVRQTGILDHTLDIFFEICSKPKKSVPDFLGRYSR